MFYQLCTCCENQSTAVNDTYNFLCCSTEICYAFQVINFDANNMIHNKGLGSSHVFI